METLGREIGFLDQEKIIENGREECVSMVRSQNECILEIVEMWDEGEERMKYTASVSVLITINLSTGLAGLGRVEFELPWNIQASRLMESWVVKPTSGGWGF